MKCKKIIFHHTIATNFLFTLRKPFTYFYLAKIKTLVTLVIQVAKVKNKIMLNQEVRKIMRSDPIVAHPNDTVVDISKIMVKQKIQQIPVVDKNDKLVGMITSYDLWKNSINHKTTNSNLVKDVMSTNVLVIEPKDKVGTAAELFIDRRFKTLPVVNIDNKLKGVITAFDVIKHVMRKEYPQPILYKEILEERAQVKEV
jgi:CBS domain-containing protein